MGGARLGAVLFALLAASLALAACRSGDQAAVGRMVTSEGGAGGSRPSEAGRRGSTAVRLGNTPGVTRSASAAAGTAVDPSATVSLILDEGTLAGHSRNDERLEVAMVDGSPRRGELVAMAMVRRGGWSVPLVDRRGRPLYPLAGQTLVVTRTSSAGLVYSQRLRIPELVLRFDRSAGGIAGRVAPAGTDRVEIELGHMPPRADKWATPLGESAAEAAGLPAWRWSGAVASDGWFEARLPGAEALAPGRPMTVTVQTRTGLRLMVHRQTPWLELRLPGGEVTGGGAPLALVRLSLRGAAGDLRGRGLGRADRRGQFHVRLRDSAGEWLTPMAGDRLTVEAGDARWSMTVPDLTARVHGGTPEITGRSTPGARVEVVAWSWLHPAPAAAWAAADAEGAWTANLPWAPAPGTEVCAATTTLQGDAVHACWRLPLVTVETGSGSLTIEALASVSGTLRLVRNGEPIAHLTADEPWAGAVRTTWQDNGGGALAMRPGDQVHGEVNGLPIHLTLPPFEASLEEGTVVGRSEPRAIVHWASPSGPTTQVVADDSGEFRFIWPTKAVAGSAERDRRCPGPAATVFVLAGDGHRVGRRLGCPSLSVDLDQGFAKGEAEPGMGLSWSGRSGVADRPAVTVPASGSFQMRLPPPLAPGAHRVLWVGQQALEIAVPPLGVDYDPARGMARGRGPAAETIELRVHVGQRSPPDRISVLVDSAGQWQMDLRGEPGSSHAYEPSAVRRLEVVWQDAAGIDYRRLWRR